MASKRRRSFPGIPEKKKIHFTPLYLREIPSSTVPGEAPHIPTEKAPPIIPKSVPDDDSERRSLYDIENLDPIEEYSKFPGVAAPMMIHIPPMLLNGMNPFFVTGSQKGKDVDMEDAEGCSDPLVPKTPLPKKQKKKRKKSSLIVRELDKDEGSNIRFSILPALRKVMFAEFDEYDTLDEEDEDEEEEWDGKPDPKLAEFREVRAKEISFSHDVDVVHDERSQVSRDSILLAAKVFEKHAQIRRESKQMEHNVDFRFQPEERFGSYPPRRPLWLLFKHDVKKRLEYKDLNHMEFVENWTVDAMPETVTAPIEYFELQAFTMGDVKVAINIPLYMFDNPQVDLKYPSRDLKEARKRGEKGVRARSRYFLVDYKRFVWSACTVVEYDRETDTFEVEWDDNGARKYVKRINFILDREDEGSFLLRLVGAKDLKKKIEASNRYMHYIKGLPFENPELVNDKLEIRLRTLVGWELSARYPECMKSIMDECRVDYHDAVNKAIQDFRFETQLHEREKLVAMMIFPLKGTKAPCPRQGCAPTEYDPEQRFRAIKYLIQDTLVIAELALLYGLQLFHRQYDISVIKLVNPLLFIKPRPFLWPHFPPLQHSWCNDRTDDLKSLWMGNVVQVVEDIVPANNVTDKQKSHVRRFAYRLHYTMTQHLRDLVLNSVEVYKSLWDDYTIKDVVEEETDFEMHDPNAPPKVEVEKKPPIFLIKVTVDHEDHFVFAPFLEEIEEVILVMLDNICDNVAGIEDLVSRLDPKVIGDFKVQEIHTISKDEPRVVAAREVVKCRTA